MFNKQVVGDFGKIGGKGWQTTKKQKIGKKICMNSGVLRVEGRGN